MALNIQFMTAEKNGRPTGEVDWKGEPKYVYVPDFDAMIQNASCEDEIEAIKKAQSMIEEGIFDGFAFEVVYMDKVNTVKQDMRTGEIKHVKEWQMLQHPWYKDAFTNVRVSKALVLAELEAHFIGKI